MKRQNIRVVAHRKLFPMMNKMGFRKTRDGIYVNVMMDYFIGWLGLPAVISKGVISFSPVVAIRNQEVERLRCLFCGEEFHGYIPPHAKISLGYLLPDNSWREWSFSEDSSIDELENLVESIENYALPFINRYSKIEIFEEMLSSYEYALIADQREIFPIIKLVRGDFDGAAEVVDEYCKNIYADTDPRAESYKNVFAPAMLSYIENVSKRPSFSEVKDYLK